MAALDDRPTSPATAIVLTGGAARRLGGVHKPALEVGGRPIVARVLSAVDEAGLAAVVVGGSEGVPPGTPVACEDPPGGGPVAAVREGMRQLGLAAVGNGVVVLLAGDLPFVSARSIRTLLAAVEDPTVELAVFVDDGGQPQWLCSAWRSDRLAVRLADDTAPRGIRGLATGLRRRELPDPESSASADVDTPGDLEAARVRSRHGERPDAAAVRVGDEPERGAGGAGADR